MSKITFYPSEICKIDQIVRAALMQPKLTKRLLNHDETLCDEFNIAAYTWKRLSMIHADTLQDFCCQIIQQSTED
jgi:hypothetical protein